MQKKIDGSLEITDKNDYYPFGLNHIGGSKSFLGSYKNYKFQGQELQETGFYSFKWRNYMPDVGRFFNIDPLAEKYPTWAPYVFSGNRIIDARELEGLEPVIINNSNGKMEVNYFAKVTPKEGMTEQQVNSHLSEVSGVLSQNESLKINMIHSETATFGIDMTKTYQGYRISTNDKGEQVFTDALDVTLQVKPKFHGNIAEVDWKTTNDGIMRRYGYQYDGLNRLLKGIYQEPQSSVPQNNFYNEEQSYDLSGNILTLRRNQAAYDGSTALLLDNLNYNYNGNKLTSVTDTSGNYGGYPDVGGNTIDYDSNGNMKTQKDKGRSIIIS